MSANRWFHCVCAAVLCLSLMSCSKAGPTGPAGATGPAGPQGEQGSVTRLVLEGTVSAEAATTGQVISVPALQLASFPLVAVYIMDDYGDWFQCNLFCLDRSSDTYNILEVAYIREGLITLYSEYVSHAYRIVIVK
jgi:hypothetical protein